MAVNFMSKRTTMKIVAGRDLLGSTGLEDHYFGADREVVVVVVGVLVRQVDAAVGGDGEAAAVEGDAAWGEEDCPGHGFVVDVADECRASLPRDLESAARGRVGASRRAWFRAHRAEGDSAGRLEPG